MLSPNNDSDIVRETKRLKIKHPGIIPFSQALFIATPETLGIFAQPGFGDHLCLGSGDYFCRPAAQS